MYHNLWKARQQVRDGGEDGDKDGSNVIGLGGVYQGNRTVDDVIWERELGDDGGNDESTRGITPFGRHIYCGYDGEAYDEQSVGVELSG